MPNQSEAFARHRIVQQFRDLDHELQKEEGRFRESFSIIDCSVKKVVSTTQVNLTCAKEKGGKKAQTLVHQNRKVHTIRQRPRGKIGRGRKKRTPESFRGY